MSAARIDTELENEEHFEVSCNILILQEDEHLAALMKLLLERENYGVQVMTSLADAILYIENATPVDLIMIDSAWLQNTESPLMPILRNYPRWNAVPVISLMAEYDANAIDRALHEGVADCLVQPYEPTVLVDRIRRYTSSVILTH